MQKALPHCVFEVTSAEVNEKIKLNTIIKDWLV